MIRNFLIILALLSFSSFAQSPRADRYENKFENDVVAVYELELPAHASASAFQSAHDTFWLSLTDSAVSFARTRGKTDLTLKAGDVRFFPSFETRQLTNIGATGFRGILVALKARGLVSTGCECTGNTGRTLCECTGGTHLEPLWALSLGEVTLAGTSLGAGEAFHSASLRDDMLLVAVTDLNLTDVAAGNQASDSLDLPALRLSAGEAMWIKSGRHQFKNGGSDAARFVTFEF